jgi:SAM-dependent methyltransferase
MFGLKHYFHESTAFRYWVIYSTPGWSRISTLNYGFSPVSPEVLGSPISRQQPFQIELYRQAWLALGRPLSAEHCLCEISCGRGGGLAFMAGRTQARCIGLEKSWPARLHARWRLGLDTRASVAPALALAPASVDAFVSVEAFHNYANDAFLQETARCLRPGGVIAIADRRRGSWEEARQFHASLFERNGYRITMFKDIMPHVLEALRADNDRKNQLLRRIPVKFVQSELNEMFACVDSERFKAFEQGAWSYFLLSAVRREGNDQ